MIGGDDGAEFVKQPSLNIDGIAALSQRYGNVHKNGVRVKLNYVFDDKSMASVPTVHN
jgi:hypothetical protein